MRGIPTSLIAVGILLATAGCGGDGGGPAEPSPGDAYDRSTPSSAAATTGTATAADEVMVSSTPLGTVLVGKDGLTLYMFDPDKQGASTCYDECAQAWPPLTTTAAPAAGAGVKGSLLGVVARKDGSQQVTYNKWPLYYWAKDTKPGDTTGQGVNNVWWVVDVQGQPVH